MFCDVLCDILVFIMGIVYIDLEFCVFIYFYVVWGMIYDYRKLEDVLRFRSLLLVVGISV